MEKLTFKTFIETSIGLHKKPYIKHDDLEGGYKVYDKADKYIDGFWYNRGDNSDKKDAYTKALKVLNKLK